MYDKYYPSNPISLSVVNYHHSDNKFAWGGALRDERDLRDKREVAISIESPSHPFKNNVIQRER